LSRASDLESVVSFTKEANPRAVFDDDFSILQIKF
jgi:hypothetical protein